VRSVKLKGEAGRVSEPRAGGLSTVEATSKQGLVKAEKALGVH
jgi:hypothetical protein